MSDILPVCEHTTEVGFAAMFQEDDAMRKSLMRVLLLIADAYSTHPGTRMMK